MGDISSITQTAKISELTNGSAPTAGDKIPMVQSGVTKKADATDFRTDWNALAVAPTTITALGNRSYSITIPGVDYTDRIHPGTRGRSTRTVASPTRCTSLNGTNQYYVRSATINGMTFTDDFATGAWVKMTNYSTSGLTQVLFSRFNGTSGWRFGVMTTGQIQLIGFNAGGGNYSYVNSNMSLPINRWIYVVAQLDMSSFTATSTTSYVMFDGVAVPSAVVRAGTNPTALVQAGNINVGAANATDFFPGKISQAWVSSAKVTQTNVNTLFSQGLTSTLISTNNIVSAWSFDNSINDLNTTNANNLTAQNSAVATNADSFCGQLSSGVVSSTYDHFIVQTATFSTDTTLVVRVPEGNTLPTSGGISLLEYSNIGRPYGFPSQKQKWRIEAWHRIQSQLSGSTSFGNIGTLQIVVPIGSDELSYSCLVQAGNSTTNAEVHGTISTANNTQSDVEFTAVTLGQVGSGTIASGSTLSRSKNVTNDTATTYYFNIRSTTGSGTNYLRGDYVTNKLVAETAYL